jgi:hypothetical protein
MSFYPRLYWWKFYDFVHHECLIDNICFPREFQYYMFFITRACEVPVTVVFSKMHPRKSLYFRPEPVGRS